MLRLILFLIFSYLFTQPSFAEIYKWVDENGKTHFTNNLSQVPQEEINKQKIGKSKKGFKGKVFGILVTCKKPLSPDGKEKIASYYKGYQRAVSRFGKKSVRIYQLNEEGTKWCELLGENSLTCAKQKRKYANKKMEFYQNMVLSTFVLEGCKFKKSKTG